MGRIALGVGAVTLGLLVGLSGCRGILVLNESSYMGQPCTLAAECGGGGTCVSNVCVPRVSGNWCDCTPSQGCIDGECVAVTPTNACTEDNPRGACVGDAVCVAGTCVPLTPDNECSPLVPQGLCPSGATCFEGQCVVTSTVACSAAQPQGLCPPGEQCAEPGVCEVVSCSPEFPSGACSVDQVCIDGFCDWLPCSPLHVHGSCDDGFTCSSTGNCIATGTCEVAADCGDFFACPSGVCVRDYTCEAAADCPSTEHCTTGGMCLPLGECVPGGDITDCGALEACSSTGRCIPEGTCGSDLDCAEEDFCNHAEPRMCLTDGQCAVLSDCPPGHECNAPACEVSGTLCTTNEYTEQDCPGGEVCCPMGQRCSDAGSCIYLGSCVNDNDCLTGYFVCSAEYQCVPLNACGTCALTDRCSYTTVGCIPGGTSPARCAVDSDCEPGEFCNPLYECTPDASCGDDTPVAATRIEPNMLIVLDRSGSMSNDFTYNSACTTRWLSAVGAISAVMQEYETDIRFGLSTYPEQNPGNWVNTNFCGDCDDTSCNDSCGSRAVRGPDCCGGDGTGDNYCPGQVDVAVGTGTRAAIDGLLDISTGDIYPGGYTPTGPTLRNILAAPTTFGLPVPGDTVTRPNYILLVTDGAANYDAEDDPLCTYDDSAATRVDCALDRLQALNPTIKTFVVGLAFGSVSDALNCNAFHGGRARQDTCPGVTADNCDNQSEACYYPAENEADLLSAFGNIAGQIASCAFSLDQVPPDISRLYVYLTATAGGTEVRIIRDDPNGWTYDVASNQVAIVGTSCDEVKAGTATPRIVIGCAGGEG